MSATDNGQQRMVVEPNGQTNAAEADSFAFNDLKGSSADNQPANLDFYSGYTIGHHGSAWPDKDVDSRLAQTGPGFSDRID
jgi:hypothetical protein